MREGDLRRLRSSEPDLEGPGQLRSSRRGGVRERRRGLDDPSSSLRDSRRGGDAERERMRSRGSDRRGEREREERRL